MFWPLEMLKKMMRWLQAEVVVRLKMDVSNRISVQLERMLIQPNLITLMHLLQGPQWHAPVQQVLWRVYGRHIET